MTKDFDGKLHETLLDGLAELSPDTLIAVGADTAYIYIGSLSGFLQDVSLWDTYYKSGRGLGSFARPKSYVYTRLLGRKVRDVYYRETPGEPRLLVFITEGIEQGKTWLLSEYEQTRKSLETALRKIEKETNNENQADII